jgi:Ca2+-binding RTX toxin-like protein
MAAPGGVWRVTARLQSTEDVAILGIAPGLRLTIAANVLGEVAAVALGESPLMQLNAWMTVAATGRLSGDTAGLALTGQRNTLVVEGRIWGGQAGVVVAGQGAGMTTVVNRGEISGPRAITRDTVADTETLRVENAGRITGTKAAFDGGTALARDEIVNSGQMAGGIRLGAGDDRYEARGGGSAGGLIQGGAGDDVFVPGRAVERISGGSGTDWIVAAGSAPLVLALDRSFAAEGQAAGDTLTGIEALRGSATAADRLAGQALADTLVGSGGNDSLWGRAGNDLLDGGLGADLLRGEDGADTLLPGAGADVVDGGPGTDIVSYATASGAMTVDLAAGRATGPAGPDSLLGVEGAAGGAGADLLIGGAGANVLWGGPGDDTLTGAGGDDGLDGNAGDDRIAGGAGSDTLAGGDGADAFVFDLTDPGADRITDWTPGDRIHLSGTGLPAGALQPAGLHLAEDGLAGAPGHRLILRTADRSLWFDPDGDGAGAARLVAHLPGHVSLTAADILIL